jgi:hypothetical protein
MKYFIQLVDSNAQVPVFKKTIGLTKDQVHGHMQNIVFYRAVVKISEEIKTLLRNKKGNEGKITELRAELKSTMEKWNV